MPYEVIRSHEICAGHRVVGHESKCRHLHGHNYVFHFHVAPKMEKRFVGGVVPPTEITINDRTKLDDLGRVIDFSVVKSTLCEWLENNWDHKFLHWEHDDLIEGLKALVRWDCEEWSRSPTLDTDDQDHFLASLVALPFNPTAENLAAHMVNVVGPMLLDEHGVELVKCIIEETSKCHVGYTK